LKTTITLLQNRLSN